MDPKNPLPSTLPSRRIHWMATAARLLLWLLAAAWILFAAGWGLIHGWIVPRIGEFRPRIELEASRALGIPVRIGDITARSSGLIPSFELRDIVLLDGAGREALRLPKLQAALSPASLWSHGFQQIFIDGPVLEIRRAGDGKVFVGGLDVTQNRGDSSGMSNWFFSQSEFVIRRGTVRWTDELRGAPPLALTGVDWVMKNGRRRHLMRLDATPPEGWGERFSLRGIFRQPLLSRDAGKWADWSGQAYGEFSRIDLSRLRQYISPQDIGLDVTSGYGGLRAWADVTEGRVAGGTADVALLDVEAQLGRELKPLSMASVAGRFGGSHSADAFAFSTEGLAFTTQDGLQWPGGNVAVSRTGDATDAAQRGELKADRLDLAALALIANRLPLGTATHAMIESYAPKGLVESVEAKWQGSFSAPGGPSSYSTKGRISGLEVASLARPSVQVGTATHAVPGRPGLSGAAVDFDLTQAGGKANVKMAGGAIEFPGVFEEPRIPMDQLVLDATWKHDGANTELQLKNMRMANADAEGYAQATWRTDPAGDAHSLGIIDLQGALSRGDGARVHRYLPMVLPQDVRHYVRDAVVQGDLGDVKFKVKGAVDHIPYADPSQGDFRITAKVKKGLFAYVPKTIQKKNELPWPALAEVDAELVFNHGSLDINNAVAKVANLENLQVRANARIADLHHATVVVNASLKGPLADALGFVNTSPVAAMTQHVLAQAGGTGSADYGLSLAIPLHNVEQSQVRGTVSLPGNDVQFTPATPLLGRLRGVATFSETGFNVAAAQARVLGGDVRFEGGSRAGPRAGNPATDTEPTVSFRAQGTLNAEGLRQAGELGIVSRIAQSATGSTTFTASLAMRRGVPEVTVASNLQGLGLSLPAPLAKSADTALPVRFESAVVRESMAPGQKLHDQLSLTVGRLAAVNYVRDVSGTEARVIRGGMGVGLEAGESAPTPENGVAANVNLSVVDIDAWEKIFATPPGTAASAASATSTASAPTAPAARGDISPAAMSYLPTLMAIRARELVVEGRKLNNVVVGGTREGLNWRANIDAAELNGYLEFRQPAGNSAGRVFARLSRLNLGAGNASDVESLLDEQPANIPALDIVVDDLELRGKRLGRVEIEAVNRGGGTRDGVREWRLNKFNVLMPEAQLTATGNWVALNAQGTQGVQGPASLVRTPRGVVERRRTVLNFKLDIADSGELLKRFGMHDVVRRGKGRMEGQVGWIGSPLALDYPSMNGQFNINVESGQFLKADPGIAKLLGVLSLQSLPRRLTLDFRDVFSQGFAFDFVRGDVAINQGVASTNNLQMKGVNAAVLMEGSADIAKETQNLKVVVVPEINAGTASLIATAINPAIGLGTFLAQYFLRTPLMRAATQEFDIDGTWTDPKIVKVERKS
ncbi:MAG: TIGR02099 family protein [Comamonadaceae bacterium]|nr:MAG: TIGR02099 family protein [Comamonadaceae bacterium]